MLNRILSSLQEQGHNKNSLMNQEQIGVAFDRMITKEGEDRQFPRDVIGQVWAVMESNEEGLVVLGEFLQVMEERGKLQMLLGMGQVVDGKGLDEAQETTNRHQQQNQQPQPTVDKIEVEYQQQLQYPTQYKPIQPQPSQPTVILQPLHLQPPLPQQPQAFQPLQQYQTPYKQLQQNIIDTNQPRVEEYSERQSVEVRNVNYDGGSVSHNINATVAGSESGFGSVLGQETLAVDMLDNQVNNQKERGQKERGSQGQAVRLMKQVEEQGQSKPKASNRNLAESPQNSPQKYTPPASSNQQSSQKTTHHHHQQPQQTPKNTPSKPKPKSKKPKHPDSLKQPLLQYTHQPTEQEIQDHLVKDIPRPALKNKSGVKVNHVKSKTLTTNKETTLSAPQKSNASSTLVSDRLLSNSEGENLHQGDNNNNKKKKIITKKCFIPMCLFVVGIILFSSSFLINSQLKRLAAQQVVLSAQTENVWAHFPGDTKTQIDRNWTFFNITNPDEMLFYNEIPKFRQIQGFKIIELEDYLNITYIEDGDRVQMVDWLHFGQQPDSRNLDEKVKVLNVGGLAYWYNIKVARPTIILKQGLGLLFNTLQNSILQNIYAQAINVQFLPDWSDDIYAEMFAPVSISFDEAWFIWHDPAYGMGNQNNLKYWIEAIVDKDEVEKQTVSKGFNFLMDYFTLTLEQMQFIEMKFEQYVEFATSSVLQNSYCVNQTNCTGRFLAYQQFSTSYVTKNPPPGKPIQPNDTICLSNVTCAGYFPELSAFYKNVYLERHPQRESSLVFDPEWMRNLVNYNASLDKKLDYNTAESCLFHIGNLDALWDNGTLFDKSYQEAHGNQDYRAIPNKYLENIRTRFDLPSLNHTLVFWQWIKYLNNEVILQNQTNEQLGVANLFGNGLYQGFSYLQDNLQQNLLVDLVHYDLVNHSTGDCSSFIQSSLQLRNNQTATKICDKYGQKITKELVRSLLLICTNEFQQGWYSLKNGYDLTLFEIGSLCQHESTDQNSFGNMLHQRRKYLNDMYDCKITPKEYCSDYELAAIQWSSSKVTLNPPPQLNLSPNHTYKGWNHNASRFEYSFYRSKYPDDHAFPDISTQQAYQLLNFDNWFSSTIVLKHFTNATYDSKLKAYMRFVGVEVGLNGLTMERSARELIFGYKDEILQGVKNAYPPFGGDPSTPSLVAFNDPNITKEEATMTLEWSTGKYNSSLVGQYRKINGLPYLTVEKDFFNGNLTATLLQSPWQGEDYFYGTSAKQFAANQFDQPNISLYVPNIQRYGSGIIDDSLTEQRYGFELKVGYLGEYIYESSSQSQINKKYYQNFHAVFNETSVVGFPLYVCKNHFMNVSSNWSSLVQIYNENGTVQYVNASEYDDSFVVVQPYTGLSFQSTIYLQSNYYHTPDSLLTFYQESLMPIFSLARSGNVTESVANDLLGPLKMGVSAVKWARILGIVIVVVSCILCGVLYYRKKKTDKKLEDSEKSSQNDDDQEEETERKEQPTKRVLKSSQLGISLQPMTSGSRPTNEPEQKYIPPPVVQEQI